ncbi:MAG: SDR family oxidoreductase [Rhodospirillaceae bacterium]|nr:SDR family oxidoreductase [Rhodospirillaceae bacterium]
MRLFKLLAAAAAVLMSAAAAQAAGELVLVTGATGKSGRPTISLLLSEGYKVRALVRDAARATDLGAGVEIVVGDVTKPETLPAAVKGVDYVISTIGAGRGQVAELVDYKGTADLIDAAKAAGVKQFVLMTSMKSGSEDTNEFLNKNFGMVLMWKGKGEEHLRKSGLPYTIVRPGGLQPFPNQPPCEAGKVGLKVAPYDGVGEGFVCRSDVAHVMVAALGNQDALGKTFSLVADPAGTVGGWKAAMAALPKD